MPNIVDAIILCGGAGLRLREVTGSGPKSMVTIAGRPFLELLLSQLQRNGFERAILAVGYQKEAIRSYFGDHAHDVHLVYSAESSPLGTGGALRNTAGFIQADTVLVMNGDSYTDASLIRFVAEHDESKADASMIVVPPDGRNDCGSVLLNESGRLVRFEEKQNSAGAQYLNAGVYLLSRRLLFDIPPQVQVSLERELLPRWLKERNFIRGFVHPGSCVDIGTPERYRKAQDTLANVEAQDCAQQGGNYL
jgi:NDP-sugar pyrophosphorylase family protein